MRLYLDRCCHNERFDDQTQPRVALATPVIEHVLARILAGLHQWSISEALLAESRNTPDAPHRRRLSDFLARAVEYDPLDAAVTHR